eukprot:8231125-Pyramimonas_sp.AAC.1
MRSDTSAGPQLVATDPENTMRPPRITADNFRSTQPRQPSGKVQKVSRDANGARVSQRGQDPWIGKWRTTLCEGTTPRIF